MNLSKRNLIIIGSIFGAVVIAMVVLGFIIQSNPNTTTPDGQSYLDPGSGEVIKSDKAPQGTEESRKNAIIYPGFSKLIDRGLSPEQLQSVQQTIAEYSIENKKYFKEVSLTVDSIRHLLPQGESTTHTITYDITVNRKDKYFMTVAYSDTATCITKLYASDKTTLLIER